METDYRHLNPIPIRERASILFLEKGRIDVDDSAFVVRDGDGVTQIPVSGLACLMPEDYFKRATKAVALTAIEEMREAGRGDGLAPEDVLADMKKGELAEAAAAAAIACGWLPPELRHPAYSLLAPSDASRPAAGITP